MYSGGEYKRALSASLLNSTWNCFAFTPWYRHRTSCWHNRNLFVDQRWPI